MEIERKFLVNLNEFNKNINCLEELFVEQYYINKEEENIETRLRKILYEVEVERKYFMTIKSKGCLERKEIEFLINENTFNELKKDEFRKGNIIYKIRNLIPLENNLIAEVDLYLNKYLNRLSIVEVEFNSMQQALQFNIPNWFGKEITYDSKYKNRNLAKS